MSQVHALGSNLPMTRAQVHYPTIAGNQAKKEKRRKKVKSQFIN
jgi:hypothetical protein